MAVVLDQALHAVTTTLLAAYFHRYSDAKTYADKTGDQMLADKKAWSAIAGIVLCGGGGSMATGLAAKKLLGEKITGPDILQQFIAQSLGCLAGAPLTAGAVVGFMAYEYLAYQGDPPADSLTAGLRDFTKNRFADWQRWRNPPGLANVSLLNPAGHDPDIGQAHSDFPSVNGELDGDDEEMNRAGVINQNDESRTEVLHYSRSNADRSASLLDHRREDNPLFGVDWKSPALTGGPDDMESHPSAGANFHDTASNRPRPQAQLVKVTKGRKNITP